ncbi:OpgC domain-containing protein [Roseomonas sp. CCTCC AB2023176]|uniref:OpgC domain-containing protein n=1 Tax=Roseomonas sp. CCTCC AB2023176 TaxID=3342640 RepID=UPI0035E0CD45
MLAGQPLSPPPRDTRLDLVRGWMQLSIFLSHATGSAFGATVIHAAWGISDSSEQFVFLSGFGLGSLFFLKASRGSAGPAEARRDLARRTIRLWGRHLLVLLAFAAMIFLVDRFVLPGEAGETGWSWFRHAPLEALPAAAAGLYQPAFMGILILFAWCMLLLPGFAWAVERFGAWALLPPALAWAAVQVTGLSLPAFGGTGIAFNPFAWALLFLLGAWFGRRALLNGRAVARHPLAVAAALAVVVLGLAFKAVEVGWVADPGLDFTLIAGKENLALPRLLHALSLAYLVAVLLPPRAAPAGASPPVRWRRQGGARSTCSASGCSCPTAWR